MLILSKCLSICILKYFAELKSEARMQTQTETHAHTYDAKEMVDLYHTLWIRPWPLCLPPQNILSDQRDGERMRYKQDGGRWLFFLFFLQKQRETQNLTKQLAMAATVIAAEHPVLALLLHGLPSNSSLYLKRHWDTSPPSTWLDCKDPRILK